MKILVALLALMMLAAPPALAALPTAIPVNIPSGEVIQFALPDGVCAYPDNVRRALKGYLEAGNPRLRLLGAAGDCYSIDRWLHGYRSAPISPTIELAMLDSQVDPALRMSARQYRAYCQDQYPARGLTLLSDSISRGLKQIDKGLTLNGEISLGLLSQTQDVVFGGMLASTTNGPGGMLLVEVAACFAPHNVPVIWIFSGAMARSLSPVEIEKRLKAALALAEDRAAATLLLNGDR